VAELRRMSLLGAQQTVTMEPLAGGVSSDIWRVDLPGGTICVKRALPRLKVAALWEAPVERSRYEWQWLVTAARINPAAVPTPIACDPAGTAFAMAYLDPSRYPVWKQILRNGDAAPATAAAVGQRLGAIHAATAGNPSVARDFASDAIFYAIRLEPYLAATARAHPDRAQALQDLLRATAATRLALVHGDVSPKNILIGPAGPVFLDAECAWYGDPAFDLAFVLNHLLLKCLWVPPAARGFLACFAALADAYFAEVRWEPTQAIAARAARLLPGLLLARIDGKSPVEYVTEESQKNQARIVARALLAEPGGTLDRVRATWAREIGA
jgi:aminoglycoside phosphotransferase (APT) family kinase protein